MQEKILSNKKLLLVFASFILVGLVVFIIIFVNRSNSSTITDIDTDSSEFDKDLDETYALLSNYPISDLLPVENETPYYYITYRLEESTTPFKLEIFYRDSSGLDAGKSRLNSSEFSEYHPENYKIIYTKLE